MYIDDFAAWYYRLLPEEVKMIYERGECILKQTIDETLQGVGVTVFYTSSINLAIISCLKILNPNFSKLS